MQQFFSMGYRRLRLSVFGEAAVTHGMIDFYIENFRDHPVDLLGQVKNTETLAQQIQKQDLKASPNKTH